MKKKIEEFFTSIEGYRVLQWAVNISCDFAALNFLCENVPLKILEKALQLHKFSILKTFLRDECSVEYDSDEVDHIFRIEKLKLLLKIGSKCVPEFMQKHQNKKWMTNQIQKTYQLALHD